MKKLESQMSSRFLSWMRDKKSHARETRLDIVEIIFDDIDLIPISQLIKTSRSWRIVNRMNMGTFSSILGLLALRVVSFSIHSRVDESFFVASANNWKFPLTNGSA